MRRMTNENVAALDPEHWNSMADFWAQLGSPLRPSPEDQASYWRLIENWIGKFRKPRIAILGVTPELYQLPWPSRRDLIALDRSQEMIRQVWPGPVADAVEADWLEMPLAEGSRDLVVCDGGMIMLDYPGGQKQMVRSLHRLLAEGGRAIFRLYVPPAKKESAEEVIQDLLGNRIGNLNILKLRLGMALQKSPGSGVAVEEIRNAILKLAPDLRTLAQRLRWPFDHLRAIEAYRDSPARYYFSSQAEVMELFCGDGEFEFAGVSRGSFPLAERCPVVAFDRR